MAEEKLRWEGWFGRQSDTEAGQKYQKRYLGTERFEQYEVSRETLESYPKNMRRGMTLDEQKAADDMIIDLIE